MAVQQACRLYDKTAVAMHGVSRCWKQTLSRSTERCVCMVSHPRCTAQLSCRRCPRPTRCLTTAWATCSPPLSWSCWRRRRRSVVPAKGGQHRWGGGRGAVGWNIVVLLALRRASRPALLPASQRAHTHTRPTHRGPTPTHARPAGGPGPRPAPAALPGRPHGLCALCRRPRRRQRGHRRRRRAPPRAAAAGGGAAHAARPGAPQLAGHAWGHDDAGLHGCFFGDEARCRGTACAPSLTAACW